MWAKWWWTLVYGFTLLGGLTVTQAAVPLAIQDQGRIQPLESYGHRMLALWGGKIPSEIAGPTTWLQWIALEPDSARNVPLFRVDPSDVAQALGLPGGKQRYYSYRELTSQRYLLEQYAHRAQALDPTHKRPFDFQMLRLFRGVQVFDQWQFLLDPSAQQVAPLRLFPDASGTWKTLSQMPSFWWQLPPQAFFPSLLAWQESLDKATQWRLRVEAWYFQIQPFDWAQYALLFTVFLVGLRTWKPHVIWNRGEDVVWFVAFLWGVLGLGVRSYLAQRPPVTNLYESLLFVAVILMGLGWRLRAHGMGKASVGGLAIVAWGLLHVAQMLAYSTDQLGVLAAVLNSPFWLTSHVLTIALGYVGVVWAGVLGHVWLLFAGLRQHKHLASCTRLLRMALAWALFFTFLGTVLGGVWADQSWGRFWGWDPKENGALLLILWMAIVLHARQAGWLGERGVALACVWGLVVLALAWFGLNMLGIGLHAYGSTGQGMGSMVYLGVQSSVALALAWWSSDHRLA